jgi:hypothetical protein
MLKDVERDARKSRMRSRQSRQNDSRKCISIDSKLLKRLGGGNVLSHHQWPEDSKLEARS